MMVEEEEEAFLELKESVSEEWGTGRSAKMEGQEERRERSDKQGARRRGRARRAPEDEKEEEEEKEGEEEEDEDEEGVGAVEVEEVEEEEEEKQKTEIKKGKKEGGAKVRETKKKKINAKTSRELGRNTSEQENRDEKEKEEREEEKKKKIKSISQKGEKLHLLPSWVRYYLHIYRAYTYREVSLSAALCSVDKILLQALANQEREEEEEKGQRDSIMSSKEKKEKEDDSSSSSSEIGAKQKTKKKKMNREEEEEEKKKKSKKKKTSNVVEEKEQEEEEEDKENDLERKSDPKVQRGLVTPERFLEASFRQILHLSLYLSKLPEREGSRLSSFFYRSIGRLDELTWEHERKKKKGLRTHKKKEAQSSLATRTRGRWGKKQATGEEGEEEEEKEVKEEEEKAGEKEVKEEEKEAEEEEVVVEKRYRGIESIWSRLLPQVFCRSKAARTGACMFLIRLMAWVSSSGMAIADSLQTYHCQVFLHFLQRSKESTARRMALLLLEHFQMPHASCPVWRAFCSSLTEDDTSAIRRTALSRILLLPHSDRDSLDSFSSSSYYHQQTGRGEQEEDSKTTTFSSSFILQKVLSRAYDSSADVRASLYRRLAKDENVLTVDQKSLLVLTGLNDKAIGVRDACSRMIRRWISTREPSSSSSSAESVSKTSVDRVREGGEGGEREDENSKPGEENGNEKKKKIGEGDEDEVGMESERERKKEEEDGKTEREEKKRKRREEEEEEEREDRISRSFASSGIHQLVYELFLEGMPGNETSLETMIKHLLLSYPDLCHLNELREVFPKGGRNLSKLTCAGLFILRVYVQTIATPEERSSLDIPEIRNLLLKLLDACREREKESLDQARELIRERERIRRERRNVFSSSQEREEVEAEELAREAQELQVYLHNSNREVLILVLCIRQFLLLSCLVELIEEDQARLLDDACEQILLKIPLVDCYRLLEENLNPLETRVQPLVNSSSSFSFSRERDLQNIQSRLLSSSIGNALWPGYWIRASTVGACVQLLRRVQSILAIGEGRERESNFSPYENSRRQAIETGFTSRVCTIIAEIREPLDGVNIEDFNGSFLHVSLSGGFSNFPSSSSHEPDDPPSSQERRNEREEEEEEEEVEALLLRDREGRVCLVRSYPMSTLQQQYSTLLHELQGLQQKTRDLYDVTSSSSHLLTTTSSTAGEGGEEEEEEEERERRKRRKGKREEGSYELEIMQRAARQQISLCQKNFEKVAKVALILHNELHERWFRISCILDAYFARSASRSNIDVALGDIPSSVLLPALEFYCSHSLDVYTYCTSLCCCRVCSSSSLENSHALIEEEEEEEMEQEEEEEEERRKKRRGEGRERRKKKLVLSPCWMKRSRLAVETSLRIKQRSPIHADLAEILITKSLGCFCLLSPREEEVKRQLKAYHVSLLTSLAELQSTARALQTQLAMKEAKQRRLLLLQDEYRKKEEELLSLLSSSSSPPPLLDEQKEEEENRGEEGKEEEEGSGEEEEDSREGKKKPSTAKSKKKKIEERREALAMERRRKKSKEREESVRREIEELSLSILQEHQHLQKVALELQEAEWVVTSHMLRCEVYCCFAGDVLLCHPSLLKDEVYRQQAPFSYTGGGGGMNVRKDHFSAYSSSLKERQNEEGEEIYGNSELLHPSSEHHDLSSSSASSSSSSSLLDLLWKVAIGEEVSTKKLQSVCLSVLVKLLILHLTEESHSSSEKEEDEEEKEEDHRTPYGEKIGQGDSEEEEGRGEKGGIVRKEGGMNEVGEEEKKIKKKRCLQDLTAVLSYRISCLLEIVYLHPALPPSPSTQLLSYLSSSLSSSLFGYLPEDKIVSFTIIQACCASPVFLSSSPSVVESISSSLFLTCKHYLTHGLRGVYTLHLRGEEEQLQGGTKRRRKRSCQGNSHLSSSSMRRGHDPLHARESSREEEEEEEEEEDCKKREILELTELALKTQYSSTSEGLSAGIEASKPDQERCTRRRRRKKEHIPSILRMVKDLKKLLFFILPIYRILCLSHLQVLLKQNETSLSIQTKKSEAQTRVVKRERKTSEEEEGEGERRELSCLSSSSSGRELKEIEEEEDVKEKEEEEEIEKTRRRKEDGIKKECVAKYLELVILLLLTLEEYLEPLLLLHQAVRFFDLLPFILAGWLQQPKQEDEEKKEKEEDVHENEEEEEREGEAGGMARGENKRRGQVKRERSTEEEKEEREKKRRSGGKRGETCLVKIHFDCDRPGCLTLLAVLYKMTNNLADRVKEESGPSFSSLKGASLAQYNRNRQVVSKQLAAAGEAVRETLETFARYEWREQKEEEEKMKKKRRRKPSYEGEEQAEEDEEAQEEEEEEKKDERTRKEEEEAGVSYILETYLYQQDYCEELILKMKESYAYSLEERQKVERTLFCSSLLTFSLAEDDRVDEEEEETLQREKEEERERPLFIKKEGQEGASGDEIEEEEDSSVHPPPRRILAPRRCKQAVTSYTFSSRERDRPPSRSSRERRRKEEEEEEEEEIDEIEEEDEDEERSCLSVTSSTGASTREKSSSFSPPSISLLPPRGLPDQLEKEEKEEKDSPEEEDATMRSCRTVDDSEGSSRRLSRMLGLSADRDEGDTEKDKQRGERRKKRKDKTAHLSALTSSSSFSSTEKDKTTSITTEMKKKKKERNNASTRWEKEEEEEKLSHADSYENRGTDSREDDEESFQSVLSGGEEEEEGD